MVFMVFSAVSIVSSFEADVVSSFEADVGVGERNKTRTKSLCLRHNFDAVRFRMKAGRGNSGWARETKQEQNTS